MDELNGRMIACQILITGLIARVANDSTDPLRFLTDFRDEIRAVVKGVNIAGMENTDRVRQTAQQTHRRTVLADEAAQHQLIAPAQRKCEKPRLSAFLCVSLERFKYDFRTISNSSFRIVLIWMNSNMA